MQLKALLTSVGVAVLASFGVQAQTVGVTDTTIKIGNTSPYSGPASAYGVIGKTHQAFWKEVNAAGGLTSKDGKTRKVEFLSLDDGYSPPRTVEQIRKLVEQDQVAFTFNTLGTPTNSAIHRYMNAKKVPQLFVATGASKWGHPKEFPWTMGFQPTYDVEGEIYANYALSHVKDPKIAILYQNDDYGKDYRDGFLRGLGDKKDLVVKMLPYEVTDPTVDSQVLELASSGANVFFNVSIPKFAAQAIKKTCEIGWKPLHLLNNVSSSVGATLKPAGLDCSKGLITAQWLKDPTDPQWETTAGYKEWSAWMDKNMPDGDRGDANYAYAYNASTLLKHVLENCADLSRPGIMACAANIKDFELPMVLPGIKVNTSPTDFYPVQAEQLSKFDGEKWVLFGDVIDASKK
ncbi:MAG: ABC transporter substrate-binding protein [Alphaproteobacteria bacterium]|nr:ABC transporter substrate-binding protein [Alphaproteobacteria bacterium]MCB9929081.1 ABC transporter substrate-binding protein [Alphaproteobacteria bacterium]